MFFIPAGTKCKVKRPGAAEWVPHETTRDHEFPSHGIADNGGSWVFRKAGFAMKVATCFVIGREQKTQQKRSQSTFNACPFGRNGRGASRRKAAKLRRK